YRFVNERYQQWFGLSQAKILGRHYRQLLGPKTAAVIQKYVDAALAGKEVTYEAELPYPRSGTRWVLAHYVPDADEIGKVKGFYALVTDITGRKRAEQALKESERRFRLMADRAPVLIWMSGTDKRCTWFNRQWLEFTGRTLEQELGDG